MFRLVLASLMCLSAISSATAADQTFPYKASVIAEEVEVRCGPGTRYYVTSLLKSQDVVTVHRHDHGGWFMISPPKGSISWIDADLVKKTGAQRGVVQIALQDGRPARAIVRIGSTLSDDHAYYGRELSNGDEVIILGEKSFATENGAVQMLKIVPPAQEFRWIKGDFLVPLDETVRQQIADDPYQIPAAHKPNFIAQKQQQDREHQLAQQKRQQARNQLLNELDQIDRRYASMMQQEPAKWDLASLAAAYRQLDSRSSGELTELIQKRLDVINRREELLSHYQNFVRVSAESARRDQELVAQQLGYETGDVPGNRATNSPVTMPVEEPQPGETLDASVAPRLNGAGLVTRIQSVPGSPQLALIAPDGRFLAFLEVAEGVRIRQWIGKPAGVIGNRQFDPQVGADVIRVQRMVPVQLVP